MTDIWLTCEIIAAWLERNKIKAPPIAVFALTTLILQSISTVRENAYEHGYRDARKENDECKQP